MGGSTRARRTTGPSAGPRPSGGAGALRSETTTSRARAAGGFGSCVGPGVGRRPGSGPGSGEAATRPRRRPIAVRARTAVIIDPAAGATAPAPLGRTGGVLASGASRLGRRYGDEGRGAGGGDGRRRRGRRGAPRRGDRRRPRPCRRARGSHDRRRDRGPPPFRGRGAVGGAERCRAPGRSRSADEARVDGTEAPPLGIARVAARGGAPSSPERPGEAVRPPRIRRALAAAARGPRWRVGPIAGGPERHFTSVGCPWIPAG